ncbi:MAG: hypothetical protein LBS20_03555 [Prevotella sp.]|jgi:hypothetical protein|nr:hypothetical protein [Prevotella sp.]
MKKYIYLTLTFLTVVLINGCTTYYISTDSLKQQFATIDSTKMKEVAVSGPAMAGAGILYKGYKYKANPIVTIQCTDKNGNPKELINSPSIETRITYGHKNKKTIFYFDRIYVDSKYVYGVGSRFIESIRSSIPLDSITKIEIQDGHKKFRYVNN